ncbi:uncharacterized protein LOC131168656 [Malania oleifera]|uniref:uncharacterized protein LOC131168656 n=1 Tax=Malania oleifera TaxID=397392 RepID=UPI0025ADF446|nr:uncharacterized protein LOC131168656 [Malania oleifera]
MATEEHGNSPTTALKDMDSGDEMQDRVFAKRGCCFWIPCLCSDRAGVAGPDWWERIRTAEKEETWWIRGWNAILKVREWSEIVAGPKWKTFIRRFNKKNRSGYRQGKFQYDPLSYSLNFDEGPGQNGILDEDVGRRDFSSRYASIPASAKTSMDFGKDGPTFT